MGVSGGHWEFFDDYLVVRHIDWIHGRVPYTVSIFGPIEKSVEYTLHEVVHTQGHEGYECTKYRWEKRIAYRRVQKLVIKEKKVWELDGEPHDPRSSVDPTDVKSDEELKREWFDNWGKDLDGWHEPDYRQHMYDDPEDQLDDRIDVDDLPDDWKERYGYGGWDTAAGSSDELPKYDYPDDQVPEDPSFWDAVYKGLTDPHAFKQELEYVFGIAPVGIGDGTLKSDTLNYWRGKTDAEIVESLTTPGSERLRIRPNGTVLQGNHRVKVLLDRGYDTSKLYSKAQIIKKYPRGPLP